MSEQPKIPEPILDALRKAAILDTTADLRQREEDEIQDHVEKLEAQLETARKALGKVGRQRQAAVEDAEHYRYMAYGRATTLALPEAQIRAADKAAQESAATPPVPVAPQAQAEPQITADDPLNLGQLDHTAAHPMPEGAVR